MRSQQGLIVQKTMRYGMTYFYSVPLLALLLLSGGCTQSDASYADATANDDEEVVDYGAVADTPPIHLRQTVVYNLDGVSEEEKFYRDTMENCGEDSVNSNVADEDVGKLGRTYYEVWYQGLRMAVRADEWSFGPGSEEILCDWQTLHTSTLWILTPDGTWDIDLIKGVGSFNPESVPDRLPVTPQDLDKLHLVHLSSKNDSHTDWVSLKFGGPSSALGQPCGIINLEYHEKGMLHGTESRCVWTGGIQWGFVREGVVGPVLPDHYAHGFSLWQRPGNVAGYWYVLTTELLTVGEPFDHSVFNVPPGIKQVPAYGSDDAGEQESDDSDGDEDSNEDE